jgi:hypothetical protein
VSRERWRVVKAFNNYQVSTKGRVRNKLTKKILRTMSHERGGYYPFVDLRQDGKRKCINVHILVAEYFLGPRSMDTEIHHKDMDRFNNNVENLIYLRVKKHRQLHLKYRQENKKKKAKKVKRHGHKRNR